MSNLPLHKAYYSARATEAPITFGTSGNGNPQIAVEFEILDDNYLEERITWVGVFADTTAARSVESLQIAGWQGDDLSELDGQLASQVLPSEVTLVIEGEEYEGQMRPKIQWINRPGGGRFKFKNELVGNDLKAFAAQMKATVKSVRASGGAPRKTAGSGQQRPASGPGRANRPGDRSDIPPPADDDLPF